MKITSTTRTIELTVEESTVTISRKRRLVSRTGVSGEVDEVLSTEEQNVELQDEHRGNHEKSGS